MACDGPARAQHGGALACAERRRARRGDDRTFHRARPCAGPPRYSRRRGTTLNRGGWAMGMWVFLAIIVIVAFWAIAIYNGLVTLRNRYKNAFSQIDVQLKRRYDLIPNLVETVKGYMKHEAGTLEAGIQARETAGAARPAPPPKPGGPAALRGAPQAEGPPHR